MKPSTKLKNRMKGLRENRRYGKGKLKQLTLNKADKIRQLNSRIHNCKNDLKLFPGNEVIEAKIKNMEDEIKQIENDTN